MIRLTMCVASMGVVGLAVSACGGQESERVETVTVHETKAYRQTSSSMEPTIHCAIPAPGCEATESDELVAEPVEALDDLQRADIVVFQTPPEAQAKCGAGGTFVKRVVGLPGETVEIRLRESEGKAYVYVNGKMLDEPYIENDRRDIGRRKHIECRPSTTS